MLLHFLVVSIFFSKKKPVFNASLSRNETVTSKLGKLIPRLHVSHDTPCLRPPPSPPLPPPQILHNLCF